MPGTDVMAFLHLFHWRVSAIVAAALGLALASCGPDDEETSTGSDSDAVTGDGTSTDGAPAWPPAACSLDESPFLQEDCLAALRTACNAENAESACVAMDPLGFDAGGYAVSCAWAKVVTFAGDDACTVQEVFGRCEPVLATECGDFCAGNDMLSDVSAIVSRGEIVELCGGPLGPWSAVGATEHDLSTCAENITPPSDPLCECAQAACDAQ